MAVPADDDDAPLPQLDRLIPSNLVDIWRPKLVTVFKRLVDLAANRTQHSGGARGGGGGGSERDGEDRSKLVALLGTVLAAIRRMIMQKPATEDVRSLYTDVRYF